MRVAVERRGVAFLGGVGEDVGDGPVGAVEGEAFQHADLAEQGEPGEPRLLGDLAPRRLLDRLAGFHAALGNQVRRPVALADQRHDRLPVP